MNSRMGWRAVCPPAWPDWARNWASSKGSLTRRLLGLGKGFEVEPICQNVAPLQKKDAESLSLAKSVQVRNRMVRLKVGGQPVVLARTVVRVFGARNDWPFWHGLGNRSLGTALFTDPGVKRGRLFFARVPARHGWIKQLTGQNMKAQGRCYVRCARYTRGSGHTPMWVFEVFLPALAQYDQEV